MPDFKLSPSDFAFLWDECKRCFYLKVARGFPPPSQPFPKIFGTIDKAMKECYTGGRAEAMAPGVPAGVVEFGDEWVQSKPFKPKGRSSSCYIRGIFDSVIKIDGGGYAVIDFKTTEMNRSKLAKYSRQLHAYAYALENPETGNLALSPVSSLGLLVYDPKSFRQTGDSAAALDGNLAWHGIDRDAAGFVDFMGKMVDVLEAAEPPPPGPGCSMCKYRESARKTGF